MVPQLNAQDRLAPTNSLKEDDILTDNHNKDLVDMGSCCQADFLLGSPYTDIAKPSVTSPTMLPMFKANVAGPG